MRLINFFISSEKNKERNIKSIPTQPEEKEEKLSKVIESRNHFAKTFGGNKPKRTEQVCVENGPRTGFPKRKAFTPAARVATLQTSDNVRGKIPHNSASPTIIVNYHHLRQSINNDYNFLKSATTLRKFNSCPFSKSDSLKMALATGRQHSSLPQIKATTVSNPLNSFYQHYNLKQSQSSRNLKGDAGDICRRNGGREYDDGPPRNHSYPSLSSSKFTPRLNSIQEIDLD